MTRERQVLDAIAREMDTLPGHVGFYYKNLTTGFTYGLREDETYMAASVIKLPIFLHVLKECAAGRMNLTDRLIVPEDVKVPSCGALNLFIGPMVADIHSLCRLMIVISDNTATNVLINHCTIPAVNETLQELGCERTVLRRLLFDMSAAAQGKQNTICPAEIGRLLEMLYKGAFISPEMSKLVIDTLLLQQVDHKLNGKLDDAVPIAHKTGEDTNLSNDVGIVYAEQPFILCFAGHGTKRYEWENVMRRAAWDLVECQKTK